MFLIFYAGIDIEEITKIMANDVLEVHVCDETIPPSVEMFWKKKGAVSFVNTL